MKSYTDISQSKKLAKILPPESADMTLPFRHTKDDKYFPGCVTARSYIDVYNEMIALPGMDKEEICKLIQPVWSLAALLEEIPSIVVNNVGEDLKLHIDKDNLQYYLFYENEYTGDMFEIETELYDDMIDSCYEMIVKLHELNLL